MSSDCCTPPNKTRSAPPCSPIHKPSRWSTRAPSMSNSPRKLLLPAPLAPIITLRSRISMVTSRNEAKRSRSTFVSLCGARIDPMVPPEIWLSPISATQLRFRHMFRTSEARHRFQALLSEETEEGSLLSSPPSKKGLGNESGPERPVRSDRLNTLRGSALRFAPTKPRSNRRRYGNEVLLRRFTRG